MKKYLIIIFFLTFTSNTLANIKKNIINNLNDIKNLSFEFEQNINGKIETGNCVIEYPKKIFCDYNLTNKKVLVSNGKSLVIKTKSGSYYRYPIAKTPLEYILDKNFLINKIKVTQERILDEKFVNFRILKDQNEINVFFDRQNYNFIGWQVVDIYQNLNITFISSIQKNIILKKDIFKLPTSN